ncbi:MAG: asparagine synthase-related protein [Promethearchaeota archaeon]
MVKTFSKILPKQILNRKKQGFSVPLKHYFKKELRDLLIENIIEYKSHNFFNKNYLKSIINGEKDNSVILWKILIFNLWYDKWFLN